MRVLTLFALEAFAGELATAAKITGWESGAAEDACLLIAARWLGDIEAPDGDDLTKAEKLRSYLKAEQTNFMAPADWDPASGDPYGWVDDNFFYLTEKGMNAAFPTEKRGDVVAALQGLNLMKPGTEKDSVKDRILLGTGQRVRVYRIPRSILAG